MAYFRSEEMNEELTVSDRHEIFSGIMLGSSDLTAEVINDVCSRYDSGTTAIDDLDSFLETHYRISEILAWENNLDKPCELIEETQAKEGMYGIYQLAKEYTIDFQQLHKNREWDGEFLDVVDDFMKEKLYPLGVDWMQELFNEIEEAPTLETLKLWSNLTQKQKDEFIDYNLETYSDFSFMSDWQDGVPPTREEIIAQLNALFETINGETNG